MAATPTRPPRHPWLWFALAGALSSLTLLLLACLAPLTLGSAARRAPQPIVPAPPAEAAAVHAAWASAMFSGDVAGATPLFAEEPPQEGQSFAEIYAELTDLVLVGGVEEFGPYQGYEVLDTFAEHTRHQVGYARVAYERGQLCFRSDLHYRAG